MTQFDFFSSEPKTPAPTDGAAATAPKPVSDLAVLRVPAVAMPLIHEPVSERAKLAVAALSNALYAGAFRRSRPTRKYRQALGAAVHGLLKAANYSPARPCFRPMASSEFAGQVIGYRAFKRAIEDLEAQKFIKLDAGQADFKARWARCGFVTRIYPMPKLTRFLVDRGLNTIDLSSDFARIVGSKLIAQPIRLSGARPPRVKGRKIEAPSMPVDRSNPIVRQYADEIEQLNEFWSGHRLEGADHNALYRKFNLGDDPTFAWNKGGRLYSDGDYQRIKRGRRGALKIDGEPTVELDISASHLTILHALDGVPLAEDPYAVPGLPKEVVKAWVTMTLGHDRFHTRWTKDASEDDRIEPFLAGKRLQEVYALSTVQKLILNHIPHLKTWTENPLSWADLQYKESQVVIKTLISLTNFNIPALPLHDSIIIPKISGALSKVIIIKKFEEEIGIKPRLSFK